MTFFMQNTFSGMKQKKRVSSPLDTREELLNTEHSLMLTETKNVKENMIITIDNNEAKDRYNIIYIIFLFFGISTLLPWNVFITVEDYFVNHKLNGSGPSIYRNNFILIIGSLGQFTNVMINMLNIIFTYNNSNRRIPYSILAAILCITCHIILAFFDSTEWPFLFFLLCCLLVFIMYIATGILNSCVFCLASIFPLEYVNALILGNNLSGCFTSILCIVSKLTSPDVTMATICYFMSVICILSIAFMGYFIMKHTAYYKYQFLVNSTKNTTNSKDSISYKEILSKTWILLLCLWLNFLSTLSIFPVYQLSVVPINTDFVVKVKWFQDIVTFLTFNILVTLGNLMHNIFGKVNIYT